MDTAILLDYVNFIKGNWLSVILKSMILLLFLWSGSYSASIAEERLRRRWVHFIMGMFLPLIYPLVILFKMPMYTGKKVSIVKKKSLLEEGPPPVEVAPPPLEEAPPAEMIDSEDLAKTSITFDQFYFKKVAVDNNGNYRGPFMLIVSNEKLKVERIIDPLPNVVVVEFLAADGKLQNMRLPYKNVGGCSEL